MGSKLLPRVQKVVDKAKERARIDEILLSSADTKWKVEHNKLRFDERPPATPSLILQKDYREWYFSALLDQLRPPKISSSDYVQLVDRVEKLSRTSLREPSGEQILALLEKYDVVVPKEVLISLLKDKGQVGDIRKKQYALTMRGTLAAPKPEAPPKWNLSCCKGLLEGTEAGTRMRYQPSLYYNLGRMHHKDNVRLQSGRASALGALETQRRDRYDVAAGRNRVICFLPVQQGLSESAVLEPDPPSNRDRNPRHAVHLRRFKLTTRVTGRLSEKAPEPIHLCIDATNNTYTIAEYTPRQTKQTEAQRPIHMQRFILNELGSRILMG